MSRKIVVKVGSSLLTGGGTSIVGENLGRIVRLVAGLQKKGHSVIVVTSGAIACGLSVLGLSKRPAELSVQQAAAATGQNFLCQAYSAELSTFGLKCAQILLTRDDFNDRARYLNIRATIDTLLKHRIIPIINENDAVSVDEIKFGDNDTLSASVAAAVEADGLLILTDTDGLYERFDAKTGVGDNLRKVVKEITPEVERMACGTDKASCVGGMSTKIKAARIATSAGIPVILANGLKDSLKIDFTGGSTDGTLFSVAASMGSKKHWIAFEARAKGRLVVDDGAKSALVHNGKSLLAPGIVAVDGGFKASDIVEIADAQGAVFAKGKVNFSSAELAQAKEKKIKGEVVHRDDLVILG